MVEPLVAFRLTVMLRGLHTQLRLVLKEIQDTPFVLLQLIHRYLSELRLLYTRLCNPRHPRSSHSCVSIGRLFSILAYLAWLYANFASCDPFSPCTLNHPTLLVLLNLLDLSLLPYSTLRFDSVQFICCEFGNGVLGVL